jgi:hypothetical protein
MRYDGLGQKMSTMNTGWEWIFDPQLHNKHEYSTQCCQGAEISAVEPKRGRYKIAGAGKTGGQFFYQICKKKGRKGAELFQNTYSPTLCNLSAYFFFQKQVFI